MKTLVLLFAIGAAPLLAHVMSMSTGDVAVQGNRAHYELRMPVYEIAHVKNADTSLFEHIRFSTAGQGGRLTKKSFPLPSVTERKMLSSQGWCNGLKVT